jgi:hypothetical protein
VRETPPADEVQTNQQPSVGGDIENQASNEPTAVEQAPDTLKKDDGLDKNKFWNCLFFLLFILGLAAIGVGVYYGIYYEDDDNNDIETRDLETDSPTASPTLQPTSGVGLGATTTFDGVIGDGLCDFSNSDFPSVVDQCACAGSILTIPDDVRARYNIHKDDFIPGIYASYAEEISSCSARNQALVWLASANDANFDEAERSQRYSLATMFTSLNGIGWASKEGWLSTSPSCTWTGVTCNNDDQVQALTRDNINAGGTVRVPSSVFVGREFSGWILILLFLLYCSFRERCFC